MHITRLRLLGFKSFVEPTELMIEHGLTGVVGPNGCGKSNLLEALRWAMGETSYKAMRGSAMEDVIFAGTTSRPARNWAEVTMFVDNSQRTAPPEFNDQDMLEVTRRIERDMGSAYRVNGREVRARDVKVLFEDAATGARSPALVRQGQIGEIVNAKPEQRRRILEDAAGVAGLHTRRHEAELRLKAAEDNLARIGDVLGGLSSQIEGLKRQARQAKRYKELSGEIRKTEALALHLAWTAAGTDVFGAESALREALTALAAATEAETQALSEEAAVAETLPGLRETEAERGATVARLRIELESFEREAERLKQRRNELEARLAQLTQDEAREEGMAREAAGFVTRLGEEITAIGSLAAGEDDREAEAQATLDAAQAALTSAESRLSDVTRRAFDAHARRQSLLKAWAERKGESEKAKRSLEQLALQRQDIAARAPDAVKHKETAERGQELLAEIGEIEERTLAAEEQVGELTQITSQARDLSAAAALDASRLSTEITTLSKLLTPIREDGLPPVVDQLTVAPGYEIALGAALGDDLDAPVAEEAGVHWRLVQPSKDEAKLPAGLVALGDHVEGPAELQRRLAQIGIVDRADGHRLQAALKPGQRLVSLEGDLWRWDGFVAQADAPTAAALRLAERNRLGELIAREDNAKRVAAAKAQDAATAQTRLTAAEGEARRLRQLWRELQAELARVRESLTGLERQARETESRLAAADEAKARTEDQMAEAAERLLEIETALETLDGEAGLDEEVQTAEGEAQARRAALADARERAQVLARERRERGERLEAIRREVERWQARSSDATRQLQALSGRWEETACELESLADLPDALDERRQGLMEAREDAERRRQEAADRHAAAEGALRKTQQDLRAAQAAVSAAREQRARHEAHLEAARARLSEEGRRIRETLEVAPEACLGLAGFTAEAALPVQGDVDRQLARLKTERDRLGGVNLSAEDALTEINEEHARLDMERLDVEAAIAKLRGAIGQLNREAKKRLTEAFQTVDGHFQRLFGSLFGGGEARLEMIESEEDPLEGGLEIIAKPPGKKPATLSLLSGGEQTLTALSLIFAVFLTNPSPICVLDEVDAPLDDSNVDRFCTLMEKMAGETATRFLVITHHPMTMARMNRLFGVTMGEKGVSQLVSVDLSTAERIIDGDAPDLVEGAA
ncbi:MAG: chromosome segregation protein SMC [Hyphomicrobiaceae bacterium]